MTFFRALIQTTLISLACGIFFGLTFIIGGYFLSEDPIETATFVFMLLIGFFAGVIAPITLGFASILVYAFGVTKILGHDKAKAWMLFVLAFASICVSPLILAALKSEWAIPTFLFMLPSAPFVVWRTWVKRDAILGASHKIKKETHTPAPPSSFPDQKDDTQFPDFSKGF